MSIDPIRVKNLQSKFRVKDIEHVRIEGSILQNDYTRNLQAEVRDPLWLLCRQWQFGEFLGDNAGSPYKVTVEAARVLVAPEMRLDECPLEPYVEAEPFTDTLSIRIQLGQYFRSLLSLPVQVRKFREQYGLDLEKIPAVKEVIENDPQSNQLYLALKRRQIDGLRLYDSLTTEDFKTWINDSFSVEEGQAFIQSCVEKFQAWVDVQYPLINSWKTRTLDYSKMISSPSTASIKVDRYAGGRLDWYDAQLEDPVSINRTTHIDEFIPTPCSYKGMPSSRWWEMEDSSINLRKVEASRTGILDALFLQYSFIYSNDWFLIPYTMTVGEMARLREITVTDVFGRTTIVSNGNVGEHTRKFSLFEQSLLDRNATEFSDGKVFYLFPAIPSLLEGDPIEQVHFMRDEMANMVWGIESIQQSQLGNGRTGDDSTFVPPDEPARSDGLLKYTIATHVPSHWTPFIPVPVQGKQDSILFRRARLPYNNTKKGVILSQNTTPLTDNGQSVPGYYINEEEITRLGCSVIRTYQRTRGAAGQVFVWIGRQKTIGRGQGNSGLVFDKVTPTIDDRNNLGHVLMPGMSINNNQTVSSRMSRQRDFDLTIIDNKLLYRKNSTVIEGLPWTEPDGSNPQASALVMSETGNLELRNSNNEVLWETKTAGNPGSMLVLAGNGSLLLLDSEHQLIWHWTPKQD